MNLLSRVFSLDLRSVALFRVLLGSLLLTDLILRSVNLATFYTDDGILPRSYLLVLSNQWYWSLHSAGGELWWQILLFTIAGLAALALIFGYRSRIAAAVSFVLLASLLNRNGLILQGGDQLLVIMCFWSLFLPLGARYAIDAALTPQLKDNPNSAANITEKEQPYFSIATVAIVFQILYLYFFTAIMKTGDAWLVRFDAAYYAVSLQQFATPIGQWMTQFPELLSVATRFVIVVEYLGPLLILCPLFWPWLRITGVLLLASLHAAFLLMLHIGLFPLIDFMALSLLLPAAVWSIGTQRPAASRKRSRIDAIIIYYDVDCGFCLKMCLLLRMFLLSKSVQILPVQQHPVMFAIMQEHNSWVVTDADGNTYIHWHAMVFLFSARWPFKPIAWLMSIPPLLASGNRVYAWVATNRGIMGQFSSRWFAYRAVSVKPTLAGSVVAGFMFYVVTSYNVYSLPQIKQNIPDHVYAVAKTARIDQRWDMFAPYPLTNSMYMQIPGKLRNGTSVNLYPLTSADETWEAPERYHSLFENYRWRKLVGRIDGHKNNAVRRAFGSYVCRAWNDQPRPTNTQLATFEINIVKHRTNTENKPKKETRRRVWRHWCYPEFADK